MSQRPTNLYKYLPPERAASVLGKLLIRLSQVSVMNDIEEFKPPISGIATETVFATMMSHNARVIVFVGYSQRAWDYFRSEFDMVLQTKSPKGIIAVGIFLFFGAVMASFAGTTLVWPGTTLDRLWTLNPRAYKELAPHTKAVGIPFLLLAVTLAVAGMGWFKRRLWGWQLAVGIIAVQVLGDLVNVFMGDLVRGGVGFVIAGALLVYLLRPEVRAAFASGSAPSLR